MEIMMVKFGLEESFHTNQLMHDNCIQFRVENYRFNGIMKNFELFLLLKLTITKIFLNFMEDMSFLQLRRNLKKNYKNNFISKFIINQNDFFPITYFITGKMLWHILKLTRVIKQLQQPQNKLFGLYLLLLQDFLIMRQNNYKFGVKNK